MENFYIQWKALAEKREITSQDIAVLCIYRSLYKNEGKDGAIKRLRKSFSPVTNSVKLENGVLPYYSLHLALTCVKQSPVMGWMDKDIAEQLFSIARSVATDITYGDFK